MSKTKYEQIMLVTASKNFVVSIAISLSITKKYWTTGPLDPEVLKCRVHFV